MSGSTEWRTPPELFAKLHAEFGFTIDAAASKENALLPRFWTAADDAISQDWTAERAYCNPPYSPAPLLYTFIEKAALSARAGGLAVMLLNATTMDTRYFHKFVWDGLLHRPRERVVLRILPGRLRFLQPDGAPSGSPRHGNMIVIFHPHENNSRET